MLAIYFCLWYKCAVKVFCLTESEMNLEKNLLICALFDCYGTLLTSKQQLLMSEYYCEDISLSEIAENQGISRQAVQENLSKAVQKLHLYESKLHLLEIKNELLLLEKEQQLQPRLSNIMKLFQ